MKIVYGLALIPVLLVGLGLYLSWLGGMQLARAFESANWSTTQGVVTVSEFTERDLNERKPTLDEAMRYFVEFEYEYTTGGEQYTSDCISIGQTGVRSRAAGERLIEPYPVGKTVTVYFDPDRPDVACLVKGATDSAYYLLLGGLMMVFLTLKLTLSWVRELQSLRGTADAEESFYQQ